MRIPRDISAKAFIKLLHSLGYSNTRQRGSHIRLTFESSGKIHHITIPNHNPLKIGTINNVLNDLSDFHEISKEELIEKLNSI